MSDLLTGGIDSMFNTTGSLLEAVRSGQVRGLAASAAERSPLAPEIPTFAESGVPGFNVSSWYGLFVPAKTPRDIVTKMHDSVAAMLRESAVKERYEALGKLVCRGAIRRRDSNRDRAPTTCPRATPARRCWADDCAPPKWGVPQHPK
jgi:hypothetical protein